MRAVVDEKVPSYFSGTSVNEEEKSSVDRLLEAYAYAMKSDLVFAITELKRQISTMEVRALRHEAILRSNADQLRIHQRREDVERLGESDLKVKTPKRKRRGYTNNSDEDEIVEVN